MVQEKPVTANKIQKKKQRNRTGHKYACAAIKKLVNVPVAGPLWPTVCHFPLLNREILASKKKKQKGQRSVVTQWPRHALAIVFGPHCQLRHHQQPATATATGKN